jgi:hypothetical protein
MKGILARIVQAGRFFTISKDIDSDLPEKALKSSPSQSRSNDLIAEDTVFSLPLIFPLGSDSPDKNSGFLA